MTLFLSNNTATTDIYTLSLHDALPICVNSYRRRATEKWADIFKNLPEWGDKHGIKFTEDERDGIAYRAAEARSEEHTSELQSQFHLVCRLLLEKKKKRRRMNHVFTDKA